VRVVVAAAIAVSAIAGLSVAAPLGPFDSGSAAHASVVVTPTGGFEDQVPRLLSSIEMVPPAELPAYVSKRGSEIATTLVGPKAAEQVGGWWTALSSNERAMLEHRAPQFLGNLEGIPFEIRGSANRTLLQQKVDDLQSKIRAAGRQVSESLKTQFAALKGIQAALHSSPGAPKRTLTTFDSGGSMRAAIAIGDIDHADDVSILVPGMFYTVAGQLADWADTAQTLYATQRSWLKRLGEQDKSVAAIAWLGYQTPDLTSVLSLTDARAGASLLTDAIAGIRASRGANQPYLSVLAHSYGSTAAFMALQHGTVKVDALAVVGSPGSIATSVRQLDVSAGRVYVGAALFDPIAGTGYFGTNPSSNSYGAHPLGVTGGIDPIDGQPMLPALGHNGYFTPGSESMRNLALMALGDCSLITG